MGISLMTIISTFYDALKAKIQADIWTSALHIANSYQIEQASSNQLADGFAIAIGPASGSDNDLSCQERFTRDILITRTKLLVATQNDTVEASVKSILEDHYTLRKELRLANTLGGISDIGFVSDGGIELLQTADGIGNYHVMSALYSITYVENLY